MTDQTIPAEKVRELADKYDGDMPLDPHFLLGEIKADLRALLPTPQPTTGLLGRWVKDKNGIDAMIDSDRVNEEGDVYIVYRGKERGSGSFNAIAPLDSLTLPEQATKPEDVPAGEAWLVDVETPFLSLQSVVAIKGLNKMWLTLEGATEVTWCSNGTITLVCPLTPERPGESDLQARYDALEQKYTELERKHFELGVELSIEQQANGSSNDWGDEQTTTPRIVATEAEYAALPIGSIASKPDTPCSRHAVFKKIKKNKWERTGDRVRMSDRHMAQMRLPVLRYGRGDEQLKPAWRIEHDCRNLRVGEYTIDKDGDEEVVVTVNSPTNAGVRGDTISAIKYGPFVVFPHIDAATPEAIKEAKQARDKEMEK